MIIYPVRSTGIVAMGYDRGASVLRMYFGPSATNVTSAWEYADVPEATFWELNDAQQYSLGKAWHAVRDRLKGRKLDGLELSDAMADLHNMEKRYDGTKEVA